jgi:hypothetical protein
MTIKPIMPGDPDYPPADIIEAARKVSTYFSQRNIKGWQIDGCADRFVQVRDFTEQERKHVLNALYQRMHIARRFAIEAAREPDVERRRFPKGTAINYSRIAKEIELLLGRLDAEFFPVAREV